LDLRYVSPTAFYITALAISPDGKRALAGQKLGTLSLWDLDTGKQLRI
jgi:hypothetical protein